jgi:hypothetical protein
VSAAPAGVVWCTACETSPAIVACDCGDAFCGSCAEHHAHEGAQCTCEGCLRRVAAAERSAWALGLVEALS